MKTTLFSMIKNEFDFISIFIEHHIPIFDKCVFIDNGSTDGTFEILKKYESKNCEVVRYDGPFDKGRICTDFMRKSDADILIPMDADELMVYDDGDFKSVSKDQQKIRNYLSSLPTAEKGIRFKIRRNFQKHPDFENWYGISNLSKVFFTKNGFRGTDQGNHGGDMETQDPPMRVNISFLDYRFYSKDYWEKRTVEKLKARLGDKWNDPISLTSYRGADGHAAYEYASYLGFKKCIGCNQILESENFGLTRQLCKRCRPNVKDEFSEGKGIWNKVRKEVELSL